MIDYKIDYVVENGVKQSIVFIFDKTHPVLGTFLISEESLLDVFLETINGVLSGKKVSDECSGNGCSIEVEKENTKLEFLYANDDEISEEIVKTENLKEIIAEFVAKKFEFEQQAQS